MEITRKTINNAIAILQIAFHIKLSPEQKDIVLYGHKTPVIVIACAGSGKTTILLFNILFSIITQQEQPDNILGITFSKKAQLNMMIKYRDAKHKLLQNGYQITNQSQPLFSTFDALFFHLIKSFPRYKNVRVLSSYTHILYPLLHALVKLPKNISTKAELKKIFELRTQLINNNETYDGYHFFKNPSTLSGIHNVLSNIHAKFTDDFLNNYLHVSKRYLDAKHKLHLIDFLDMKVLLLRALNKKSNQKHILSIMKQYHLCFIDEFQDIDNLEWSLIRKILPQKTLNALTVIGDDDQSIYAFRGSNPKIILNFTHTMPSSVRFNLSTNYRTNRHVLSSVKPLIENNKYRMKKSLKASHSIPGGVYQFVSNKYATGGELLLNKVWKMYQSSSINNKDIVVLVRYNLDKMIATDWFANHHLYLKSNYVLQNNYVYKAIVSIIQGIYFDDLHSLNRWFQVLGFKQYKHHIQNVKQLYYPRINSLSLFICSILKYDKKQHFLTQSGNISQPLKKSSQHSKNAKKTIKIIETDLELKKAWDIRESKHQTGANFFNLAEHLVHSYFNFMISHHYMSKNNVYTVEDYLNHEMNAYSDVGTFLSHEVNKVRNFKNLNDDDNNKITILTIHQSKGLQFKYVFLYNLTNLDVTIRYQHINWSFSPNISKFNFLKILLKLSKRALLLLDSTKSSLSYHTFVLQLEKQKKSILNFYQSKAKYKKFNVLQAFHTEYRDELNQIIANKYVHNSFEKLIQKKFNHLYTYTINVSTLVEEERRLIYVGFTRAKDSAVFNYGSDSNPLLNELKINKYHIMVSNKNHIIVPLIQNKNHELEKVNSQISTLKQKRRQLMNK